ncbi:MAG: matrixin family metalloprotease [Rhodobacteraceae bacterium]|nr:matrixin family metalloprotease [Paracoccaceae bacterium]
MWRLLGSALVLLAVLTCAPAQSAGFRLLRIDGLRMKWGAPAFGEGAQASYGFATIAETFPDAINCGEMAPMAALSRVWGGDPALLERIAAEAFAMWSAASAIVFRRAEPGERPDILIGAQGEPRRVAFANVWFDAEAARNGIAPLTRATICFNPAAPWASEAMLMGDRLSLRTVLAHEIGHAIGLDHPGATGALMGFQAQPTLDHLLAGDVAGAVALYGER